MQENINQKKTSVNKRPLKKSKETQKNTQKEYHDFLTVTINPNGRRKKIILTFSIFLVILIFSILGTFYLKTKETVITETNQIQSIITPQPTKGKLSETAIKDFEVALKENKIDKTNTDVYLKDKEGKEIFFATIPDVYRNHYHPAEYHKGNLYVILRKGKVSSRNWSDELWKYNQLRQGLKLFTGQGIDFRVSEDEKLIAVETGKEVSILDADGRVLKVFKDKELILNLYEESDIGILSTTSNYIWLSNKFGPNLTGLIKINALNFEITKYELSTGSEYAVNFYKEKVAYSNYPNPLDEVQVEEYKNKDLKVNLTVYDLNSKEKKLSRLQTQNLFTQSGLTKTL